ncbi:VOC family protein [Bacillus marasmi]|uniref:VOC family protein n=1 Tax=Bacillus marasmi TaxID=1926279 RepID=UPI0011C8B9A9|nr:VOC family protein [Bacillus marasmi]
MKINRIDHVSINVNDLSEAKAFFIDLGLEVKAEWELDGEQLDRIVGLKGVKTACVGLGMPDGKTWIELVKYITPSDEGEIQQTFANTLGIRHICFAVEDIEAIIAKLKQKGTEVFSEIEQYGESYKLCYVRGPEGIILELAEKIG